MVYKKYVKFDQRHLANTNLKTFLIIPHHPSVPDGVPLTGDDVDVVDVVDVIICDVVDGVNVESSLSLCLHTI